MVTPVIIWPTDNRHRSNTHTHTQRVCRLNYPLSEDADVIQRGCVKCGRHISVEGIQLYN